MCVWVHLFLKESKKETWRETLLDRTEEASCHRPKVWRVGDHVHGLREEFRLKINFVIAKKRKKVGSREGRVRFDKDLRKCNDAQSIRICSIIIDSMANT